MGQGVTEMKKLVSLVALFVFIFALASFTFAADPAPASTAPAAVKASVPTVKGTFDIDFKSRKSADESGTPKIGEKDIYTLDLTVANTLKFGGTIECLPSIFSSTLGIEKQAGELNYNLVASICNPANPAQTKAVGKLVGGALIDRYGVYDFKTLRIAVNAAGNAQAFESKFSGKVAGKPPVNNSTLSKAKNKAATVTKQVKGMTVKILVTKYDKISCTGLVLAMGPAKNYPEVQVNGDMIYDYERDVWFFTNMTMAYLKDGKTITDKVTGNIKWVKSPQYSTNGESEYQFDVRINEPETTNTEATVFQPTDDEASFFAVDPKLECLTGTAKYKDTLSGESVVASKVSVDLIGNNLSKQQVVNLTKLIWFVGVIPMNAE